MLAIKVVCFHKGIFLSSPLNSQELRCNTQCKYNRNLERGEDVLGLEELRRLHGNQTLMGEDVALWREGM